MSNIINGMIAGLVATVVLSALMMAKSMMGIMPELDVIGMLGGMMGTGAAMGWVAHFLIGIVAWGAGFAMLNAVIPGNSQVMKGILFGVAGWLMMMAVVMPMAGAGLFGMKLGMMAPIMTLMLHIIFGAVLGKVYSMRVASPDTA